jgi:hypothetical protein
MPEPLRLREVAATSVAGGGDAARWRANASPGSETAVATADGAVSVSAKLGPGDRWVYPIFAVRAEERPAAGFNAVRFTLSAEQGSGTYRLILDEANGSSYVVDLTVQPKPGETIEAVGLLSDAAHGGGWSGPDPNAHLDLDQLKSFKIGLNTKDDAVRYSFKNLRWVKL